MGLSLILALVIIGLPSYIISRWSFVRLTKRGVEYALPASIAIFITCIAAIAGGLFILLVQNFSR